MRRRGERTRRERLARRMFLFNRRHSLEYESTEPGGAISRTMDSIARAMWYSADWSKEQARKPWVVEHMVECVGVTEADIRDLRYEVNRDVVIVRLWNWRKFCVAGIDMTTHEYTNSRRS